MESCSSLLGFFKITLLIFLINSYHLDRGLAARPSNLFQDAQHRQDPLVKAVTLKTFNALHLAPFKPQIVFQNGYLLSTWETCSQQPKPQDCSVLPIYQDRISFLYTYNKDRHAEYRLRSPEVWSRTNYSDPVVTSYAHGYGKAWFTLLFRCRRRALHQWNEVLDLTVPITDHYSVRTTLIKRCASGVTHPHLQVGFIQNDQLNLWEHDELHPIHVSASTAVTTVVIRLRKPATAVGFGKSSTETSNRFLALNIRGLPSNGTFLQGDNKIWLLYSCNQSGTSSARLTIALSPWKPLMLRFNKSCGGSAASGLYIGSNGNVKDVVDNGITQPSFIFTPGNETRLHTVPVPKTWLTLSVSNNGLDTLHIGAAHITMHNRSVMDASIRNWDPVALHHGEHRTFRVKMDCKQNGAAVLQISIPVLQHQAAEFWVRKRCTLAGRPGTMPTMTLLVVALPPVILIGLWADRTWRKRASLGYHRVRQGPMGGLPMAVGDAVQSLQ